MPRRSSPTVPRPFSDIRLPGTVDPDLEELPGGNYLFDWGGEGRGDEKVVTHGSHFSLSELVSARETFHDLENQRAVYET